MVKKKKKRPTARARIRKRPTKKALSRKPKAKAKALTTFYIDNGASGLLSLNVDGSYEFKEAQPVTSYTSRNTKAEAQALLDTLRQSEVLPEEMGVPAVSAFASARVVPYGEHFGYDHLIDSETFKHERVPCWKAFETSLRTVVTEVKSDLALELRQQKGELVDFEKNVKAERKSFVKEIVEAEKALARFNKVVKTYG